MQNENFDHVKLVISRKRLEQERLAFQAEQQRALDDYVEWYQTVGCLDKEEREELEEIARSFSSWRKDKNVL